ncbi:MAG TPA: haloacid dehalogenase-like hydrolase [Verrucomicrobiae bacterium]|nr:haloacid dehalogenase-like hydrolase [Verrucomicrobiae bacterium]
MVGVPRIPKILFIDWDKTLSNSRFWEYWEPAKRHLAAQALFADAPDLVRDWMRGYLTAGQAMEYTATVTGLPYDELMQELQRSCERMRLINEDDIRLIQAIRHRGVHVVVATDNMDTFTQWTIPSLGLDRYFDGFLVSADEQALKSQIAHDGSSTFFRHFFTSTGVNPGASVILDDSSNNRVLEERLGIRFRHVTPSVPLNRHLQQINEDLMASVSD